MGYLFHMVQLKIGAEEKLQELNVEEIAVNGVVLRDRVTESDSVVIHGAVDSLLVEEMGKILVQELHQLTTHIHAPTFCCWWWSLFIH